MPPEQTDPSIVALVVRGLRTFAVVGLVGLIWLAHGNAKPEVLAVVAPLVAASLAALGAILVSTRSGPPQ